MNAHPMIRRAMIDTLEMHGPVVLTWPAPVLRRTLVDTVLSRLAAGRDDSASVADVIEALNAAAASPQQLGDFWSRTRDRVKDTARSVLDEAERFGERVGREAERIGEDVVNLHRRAIDVFVDAHKDIAAEMEKHYAELCIAAGAFTQNPEVAGKCIAMAGQINALRGADDRPFTYDEAIAAQYQPQTAPTTGTAPPPRAFNVNPGLLAGGALAAGLLLMAVTK